MGTKAIKVAPELQLEIEQFYYHEAELLDFRRTIGGPHLYK